MNRFVKVVYGGRNATRVWSWLMNELLVIYFSPDRDWSRPSRSKRLLVTHVSFCLQVYIWPPWRRWPSVCEAFSAKTEFFIGSLAMLGYKYLSQDLRSATLDPSVFVFISANLCLWTENQKINFTFPVKLSRTHVRRSTELLWGFF